MAGARIRSARVRPKIMGIIPNKSGKLSPSNFELLPALEANDVALENEPTFSPAARVSKPPYSKNSKEGFSRRKAKEKRWRVALTLPDAFSKKKGEPEREPTEKSKEAGEKCLGPVELSRRGFLILERMPCGLALFFALTESERFSGRKTVITSISCISTQVFTIISLVLFLKRRGGAPAKTFLIALLLAAIVKAFVLDLVIVSGDSMSPALKDGQLVLVNKLAWGIRLPLADSYLLRWGSPNAGDVAVFLRGGTYTIKRCVAVEGMTLRLSDAGSYSLLAGEDVIPLSEAQFKGLAEVEGSVPQGSVFVAGDNTAVSFDSRDYGLVSADSFCGKVIWGL